MSSRSRPSARPRRLSAALAAVVAAGVALSGCAVVDDDGFATSLDDLLGAPSSSDASSSGADSGADSATGSDTDSPAGSAQAPQPNDASADPPPPAPLDPGAAPGGGADGGGEGASQSNGAGPLGAIRAQLSQLQVKGRAPKTGYDRVLFGQRWSDDVPVALGRNGCDTRNDILRRDLVDVAIKPNTNDCVALAGTLHDPFTGAAIPFERGSRTSSAVQIDHVVAMSDAWQKGAQGLDEETRRAFANDPLNLLAVDGPSNQRKSDGDAATWLPPNSSFRCQYVARQVAVKHRYGLWVTPAEREALDRWLGTCAPVDDAALAALVEGAVAERR
ncbi:HNH endonuclease family protein [Corynebacterium sp. NPDC060344]|uniref:HNH endonuclease family protein n=1 Tax=Corynebacterium sp. NPDC060344 TaxID=3347101 RepID=UPI003647E653